MSSFQTSTSSLRCATGIEIEEGNPLILQSYSHLLHSSDPPSDTDYARLHLERALARERLHSIYEQMEGMPKPIDSLIDERVMLLSSLKAYDTILHPVRRVPAEVLGKIFLRCQCINETLYPPNKVSSLDTRQMPWVLAQVSSRWRAVSLGYKRLWSSICITGTTQSNVAESSQREFCLAAQLDRSANYPLTVTISSLGRLVDPALIQIVVSSSPRWRKLSLNVPLSMISSLLPIEGRLQGLEALYARLPLLTDYPPYTQQFGNVPGTLFDTMFLSAPQLMTVVCRGWGTLCSSPRVPSSQISHLDLVDWLPSRELFGMLRLLPQIQRLKCTAIDHCDTTPPSPVQLDHLQVLLIVFLTSHGSFPLGHLVLPSLVSLAVKSDDPNLHTSLYRLLDKSQPSLVDLNIDSCSLSTKHCLRLLRHIPTLHTLTLSPNTCGPRLISGLLHSPSMASLLKRLIIGRRVAKVLPSRRMRQLLGHEVANIKDILLDLMSQREDLRVSLCTKSNRQGLPPFEICGRSAVEREHQLATLQNELLKRSTP